LVSFQREKNQLMNIQIDVKDEFPPINNINSIIKRLNLGIYTPLSYVLSQKKDHYADMYDTVVSSNENIFSQVDREKQLVKLMRILMLKRMESSIHSFRLTIAKVLGKIDDVLETINSGQLKYDPSVDIRFIDPEEDEFDHMMFGKKKKVLFQDIDLIKWEDDLKLDKAKFEHLLKISKEITHERDEKLRRLKEMIRGKIENPINGTNSKVMIFTAFSDTAEYLYKHLHKWALKEFGLYTGIVTGSGKNKTTLDSVVLTDINDILTNFSPISKEREKVSNITEEIDILIGTDCISEGQNLQDCDYLINYDIHWNPVRIIQRFGRIDRIGSINNVIQLANF